MQIPAVDVRQWTEFAPIVGVKDIELEVSIDVSVCLFHDGVFERVTEAESALAMEVIIHPLIGGRGLFGDSFERGMRMQESQGGGQAQIGNAVDPHAAIVLRDVPDEPINCVVCVRGLVNCFRISGIDLGGEKKRAF